MLMQATRLASPQPLPFRKGLSQTLKAAGAAVLALLIASLWLVFPYLIDGEALLSEAGTASRLAKGGQVSRFFSRTLLQHPDLELVATFATEDFFQYVDDAAAIRELRPDQHYIFYVSETVHQGRLPAALPQARLHVGDLVLVPATSAGPVSADHHRVSVFSFSRTLDDGTRLDLDGQDKVLLEVQNSYLGSATPLSFLGLWQAPYALPEEVAQNAGISLPAMLTLGAGLLASVLTPCLLQMMLVFGSITTGYATVPGATQADTVLVRRKLLLSALAFTGGFTVLYVAAGALIGALGFTAQLLFAEYRASVSAVAGSVVLLLGIWVLLRGHQQVLCRIPVQHRLAVTTRRDMLASVCAALGTALGCTVCFGGAIVGTLIIYVGSLGDPLTGAGIMLVFALGFAIPLLLSAWWLGSSPNFLGFLGRWSRPLNYLQSLIIMGFGVILMTDNFHVVSDLIYPYLGLNR